MGFTKEEKDRVKDLLADPKLLNQGNKNCCGTSVLISGILELYKYDLIRKDFFNNLFSKIEYDFNVQGPAYKAYKIGSRLQKRVKAGILEEELDGTSADIKLGIGMLLMFKQHLKQHGKDKIWKRCEDYSLKMKSDWEHGDKIGKIPKDYNVTAMTYKNGDIAITQDAIKYLLSMMSKAKDKKVHTEDLTRLSVSKFLTKLRSYKDNKKMMIVMGVKIASQKKTMKQGGLVHWVYVPHSNFSNTTKLEVWTWGRSYEITDLKDLKLDSTRKWGGVRSFAIRMV